MTILSDLWTLGLVAVALLAIIAAAVWREQLGVAWKALVLGGLLALAAGLGRGSALRDEDDGEDDDDWTPEYRDRLDEVTDEADHGGDDDGDLDDDELAEWLDDRLGG